MPPFRNLDASAYALPAELTARLLSPALIVDLDRVRANLATVIAQAGGETERWRPHVKTAKIPEVFAEYARAGVRQYKCATVREARELLMTLARCGLERADVLLAYPLVGPALGQLGLLAERYPQARVSVLCEVPGAVQEVPPNISIFIDVNPGMHRTGVPAADVPAVVAVARAVHASGPRRLRGLHYYDGHLHGTDPAQRRSRAHACYADAVGLVHELCTAGLACDELITSGTPTYRDALAYAPFRELGSTRHRISPGTVVYHDARSEEEHPQSGLVPAALLFTRVVSHPSPDRATCDAGAKSLAAEAGDPCAVVLGHPDLVCEPPSEEHLPLRVRAGAAPARGAPLLLVPRHVCPTVNLAESAVLLERGREPRAAPVTARAHDLGL